MLNKRRFVYRHFNADGVLLYVGRSAIPLVRQSIHSNTSDWWDEIATITLQKCKNDAHAAKQEQKAIKEEEPLYNINHNDSAKTAICLLNKKGTPHKEIAAQYRITLHTVKKIIRNHQLRPDVFG